MASGMIRLSMSTAGPLGGGECGSSLSASVGAPACPSVVASPAAPPVPPVPPVSGQPDESGEASEGWPPVATFEALSEPFEQALRLHTVMSVAIPGIRFMAERIARMDSEIAVGAARSQVHEQVCSQRRRAPRVFPPGWDPGTLGSTDPGLHKEARP